LVFFVGVVLLLSFSNFDCLFVFKERNSPNHDHLAIIIRDLDPSSNSRVKNGGDHSSRDLSERLLFDPKTTDRYLVMFLSLKKKERKEVTERKKRKKKRKGRKGICNQIPNENVTILLLYLQRELHSNSRLKRQEPQEQDFSGNHSSSLALKRIHLKGKEN